MSGFGYVTIQSKLSMFLALNSFNMFLTIYTTLYN